MSCLKQDHKNCFVQWEKGMTVNEVQIIRVLPMGGGVFLSGTKHYQPKITTNEQQDNNSLCIGIMNMGG